MMLLVRVYLLTKIGLIWSCAVVTVSHFA